MRVNKKPAVSSPRTLTDAFADFLFDASEAEIDQALAESGEDPNEVAERAELAIDRAIARIAVAQGVAKSMDIPQTAYRFGLGALLTQLMRRDATESTELALALDVEPEELERIQNDPTFIPSLRTLFHLENHFHLPERSLGFLSGALQGHNHLIEERATRFAAHSGKDPGRLSRRERRELTEFIRFLAESTDDGD